MKKGYRVVSLFLAMLILAGTLVTAIAASDVAVVSGVTEVGMFDGYANRSDIKTLYVARGVETVGSFAFDGCSNLSRVELSDTVTKVDAYAFDDTKINRIGIPSSVTTINGYSFDTHGLVSYSDAYNKHMVVYCEPGSMAEVFAKKHDLTYFYATMIHAPDGKTMMVTADEKMTYIASGQWFDAPPVLLYAADGRSKYFAPSQVEAHKKVGWYTEPFVKMYAVDGRTKYFHESQVEAQKTVGWYDAPPVLMYTIDGRTKYYPATAVEAQKTVGWFDGPPVLMYTIDGRTKYYSAKAVEAQKTVGWYTAPPVIMFASDGRTKYFAATDVEAHRKVGWYTESDYLNSHIGQVVKSSGYNTAVKKLEKHLDSYDSAYIKDAAIRGRIQNKITSLISLWYASIKCPMAVISWSRSENSIGIPEISITFRNVSPKTIVAFEQIFTCYDAYGKATTDYPSLYNASYTGYMDGERILPGEEVTYYWTLYNNERTHKVSWPKMKKVAFSDGTTWRK